MADWLIILNNKIIRQFPLNEGEKITIGRGQEADIVLDNTAISRLHLSIESTGGIYLVSDMGSTNGTFVDGNKIQSGEPVSTAALIEFGKFRLAPAAETDADLNIADSVSADMMNLDEETVFVTGAPTAANGGRKFSKRSGETRLTLISGTASPNELSIEGKNSIKIGKDASCDIVIPGFFVAGAQCYIFRRGNDLILVPQKSWAGTYVNGNKITGERKLGQGDVIKVNKTSMRFNR
jgi:pSer/pThr/pTyr-binding forkhead associated (FHA) protein